MGVTCILHNITYSMEYRVMWLAGTLIGHPGPCVQSCSAYFTWISRCPVRAQVGPGKPAYARFKRAKSEGAPLSMVCSTSKAVCPADKARAWMKLKWNRCINRQERTTPYTTAQNSIFLYRVVFSFWKWLPIPLKDTAFDLDTASWDQRHCSSVSQSELKSAPSDSAVRSSRQ